MEYNVQIAEPSELYKPFVRYYKYLESDLAGVMKAVPIAYPELYFNFTGIHLFSQGYFDLAIPKVHLVGIQEYEQDAFSNMSGSDRGGGFAIVFHPSGFQHLFNIKCSEFCKYAIPGNILIKKRFDDLWQALYAHRDVHSMKNLFEKKYSKNAKIGYSRSEVMNSIFNVMNKSGGLIRVTQISKKYNISPRTLQRKFKDDIGIPPSEILQIFRINKAISLLKENPGIDLSEISYLSGYYDQSHFIKDIRKMTNLTPGQFEKMNGFGNVKVYDRIFV